MTKTEIKLQSFGREYILLLIDALENRKNKNEIDEEVYEDLKTQYTEALEGTESKSFIRDGFVSYKAFAPDLDTINDSVKQLEARFDNLEEEISNIENRMDKLDDLVKDGKIAESTANKKKREYRVLIHKIDEDKQKIIDEIPNSLLIVKQLNDILNKNIDELTAETAVEGKSKSEFEQEKKRLEKLHKETIAAAKKLSSLANIDFDSAIWDKKAVKETEKATISEKPIDESPI
ncbi:MAG: hypothetical protein ACFFDW_11540, partial [Candidatus Thorarchaeota archaeon]